MGERNRPGFDGYRCPRRWWMVSYAYLEAEVMTTYREGPPRYFRAVTNYLQLEDLIA
jgi:hypothetical protein